MPQGWDSIRYQLIDTLSHTIGHHDFKTGVDIQLDDQNTYFLGNKDGTFTFRTDAPFDPNDRSTYPFQYTRTIGDWYDPRKNEIYSGFVQDTWRAHSRLTLNLGVRYDTETIFARAKSINVDQDFNNFAPRLGATWTPTADGRMSAAARKRISEAQKARWAKQKRETSGTGKAAKKAKRSRKAKGQDVGNG